LEERWLSIAAIHIRPPGVCVISAPNTPCRSLPPPPSPDPRAWTATGPLTGSPLGRQQKKAHLAVCGFAQRSLVSQKARHSSELRQPEKLFVGQRSDRSQHHGPSWPCSASHTRPRVRREHTASAWSQRPLAASHIRQAKGAPKPSSTSRPGPPGAPLFRENPQQASRCPFPPLTKVAPCVKMMQVAFPTGQDSSSRCRHGQRALASRRREPPCWRVAGGCVGSIAGVAPVIAGGSTLVSANRGCDSPPLSLPLPTGPILPRCHGGSTCASNSLCPRNMLLFYARRSV